jgi:hypothetical protein
MSSRMIVFRLSPVSRSVLRIEQPSRRHRSAWIAEAGFETNVSRVSFVWDSENRDLQAVHFQRWMRRLPKEPAFTHTVCWHLIQVMGFSPLVFCRESRTIFLGLDRGLPRDLD